MRIGRQIDIELIPIVRADFIRRSEEESDRISEDRVSQEVEQEFARWIVRKFIAEREPVIVIDE